MKLRSGTGRITIDNTLDERLRLLEDRVCDGFECLADTHPRIQMLPEIRHDIFGINENRKFYA